MSNTEKYLTRKISQSDCAAQDFGRDGLPLQCDRKPVWELVHSEGRTFHVCEYHIEVFWNMWLGFRDAVRDVWPFAK
jgi:hypothetical protein